MIYILANLYLYLYFGFRVSRGTCATTGSQERVLFLHDSRDCPETDVSLLHQKRLGSGSEPTKEKIKLLK